MQVYPYTIVFCSLLVGSTAFVGIREGIKGLKERDAGGIPQRRGDYFAGVALSNQLGILMLLFALWYFESPNFLDFGYNGNRKSVVLSLFGGVIGYFALIGAYKSVAYVFGLKNLLLAEAYLVHRMVCPRSTQGRRKLLAVLLINPFTEELIYRGFLVYYLGNLLNSVWQFSIFGVMICLAIHFYQGARMLHFHALFCFGSILILFSPAGIIGCFGFHLAGDLYPFSEVKRALHAWRTKRRQERLDAA